MLLPWSQLPLMLPEGGTPSQCSVEMEDLPRPGVQQTFLLLASLLGPEITSLMEDTSPETLGP